MSEAGCSTPRRVAARLIFVVGIALFALACEDERRADEGREAERVVFAVNALRAAEAEAKAARLSALRGLPCSVAAVCELRDHCADAYALHIRGVEAVRAVRYALDTGASTGPAAVHALDQAEKDVKAARAQTKRCADLQGELIRKYSL